MPGLAGSSGCSQVLSTMSGVLFGVVIFWLCTTRWHAILLSSSDGVESLELLLFCLAGR